MEKININDRVYLKNAFDPPHIFSKENKGTIIGVFDEDVKDEETGQILVSKGDYQVQIDNLHTGTSFTPVTPDEVVLIN